MSYRTILLQVLADAENEHHLHAARGLALRFEAVLVGICVAPCALTPEDLYGSVFNEARPALVAASREAAAETSARAAALFARICGDAGRAWKEVAGDPATVLMKAARCADLVVASHLPPCHPQATAHVLEHLLVGAGPPVLVLPPSATVEIGDTVLVGWNGSREAYRAAHDALPFLRTARHVILCSVGEPAADSLIEAASMLHRHGVRAGLSEVIGPSEGAGPLLLEQAKSCGADLLVLGAYGHSRLQELVFGGTTRHVLQHANLPLLFAA